MGDIPREDEGETLLSDLDGRPMCLESNGGSYRCTRPAGHKGEHWQAVIYASWGHGRD